MYDEQRPQIPFRRQVKTVDHGLDDIGRENNNNNKVNTISISKRFHRAHGWLPLAELIKCSKIIHGERANGDHGPLSLDPNNQPGLTSPCMKSGDGAQVTINGLIAPDQLPQCSPGIARRLLIR